MRCPVCGTDTDGKFCPECGTPVKVSNCAACQATLLPDAYFCTQCGARVRGSKTTPAYLIGGALFAVVVVLLIISLRGERQPAANTDVSDAPGPVAGSPPPLTGTPREQADRLFNRIMQERESGDTARARFFLPMAITAYQSAGPLDNDGRYHLSVLQSLAGDAAAARRTAEQILSADQNHLLGLHAAAMAALAQKDQAAARRFYQRILNAYAVERARDLPEYRDHASLLPQLETEARTFLR